MRPVSALVMATLGAALAQQVAGQTAAYPNRPIRLVLPAAPGGPVDVIGRTVGQGLAETLGQSIVIDNRAGAGGIIGAEIVARGTLGPLAVAVDIQRDPKRPRQSPMWRVIAEGPVSLERPEMRQQPVGDPHRLRAVFRRVLAEPRGAYFLPAQNDLRLRLDDLPRLSRPACGDGASYSSIDVGSASETYFSRALTEGIIRPKENNGSLRAQLVDSLSGKIIRIDPDTGDGIPGNPFFDPSNPRSARSRVWSLGLRNPYRMTLRPCTGSHQRSDANPGVLYIGDVGLHTFEDLNVAMKPGLNFGWPLYEGFNVHAAGASFGSAFFQGTKFDVDASGAQFLNLFDADADGDLLRYERVARYVRGQAKGDDQ